MRSDPVSGSDDSDDELDDIGDSAPPLAPAAAASAPIEDSEDDEEDEKEKEKEASLNNITTTTNNEASVENDDDASSEEGVSASLGPRPEVKKGPSVVAQERQARSAASVVLHSGGTAPECDDLDASAYVPETIDTRRLAELKLRCREAGKGAKSLWEVPHTMVRHAAFLDRYNQVLSTINMTAAMFADVAGKRGEASKAIIAKYGADLVAESVLLVESSIPDAKPGKRFGAFLPVVLEQFEEGPPGLEEELAGCKPLFLLEGREVVKLFKSCTTRLPKWLTPTPKVIEYGGILPQKEAEYCDGWKKMEREAPRKDPQSKKQRRPKGSGPAPNKRSKTDTGVQLTLASMPIGVPGEPLEEATDAEAKQYQPYVHTPASVPTRSEEAAQTACIRVPPPLTSTNNNEPTCGVAPAQPDAPGAAAAVAPPPAASPAAAVTTLAMAGSGTGSGWTPPARGTILGSDEIKKITIENPHGEELPISFTIPSHCDVAEFYITYKTRPCI